ncbi:MAG: ATP synthase subunit I [bacterium]
MEKRIYKLSIPLLIVAAGVSAFFEWKKFPLSVLLGGALGLANHMALTWGVEGMINVERSFLKLLFFSAFRLVVLFLIILVLALLKLINLMGVLVGFTVVFTVILREGFLAARKND